MKVKAFELIKSLPELKETQAIAVIQPWIDVNAVGTLVLEELINQFQGKRLGRLTTPGDFYDFTRYRPIIQLEKGTQRMELPNTEIYYAKHQGNDYIFLKLLEPQMQGELYVESVLELLNTLNVKRYTLLGSMAGAVPHTKPLIVTAGSIGKNTIREIEVQAEVQSDDYQGPSTICFMINQEAPKNGIETMYFLVNLPPYIKLEEDYMGKVRLLEVLNSLYTVSTPQKDKEKAQQQLDTINQTIEQAAGMKDMVVSLENMYEEQKQKVILPPEIQKFIDQIERGDSSSV